MSADDAGRAIDTLLSEERRYPPPEGKYIADTESIPASVRAAPPPRGRRTRNFEFDKMLPLTTLQPLLSCGSVISSSLNQIC